MSLLHDDPPAATAVGRSGLMVKQFEDGAIGLIDAVDLLEFARRSAAHLEAA